MNLGTFVGLGITLAIVMIVMQIKFLFRGRKDALTPSRP